MSVILSEIFDTKVGKVNICTDSRHIKEGDFFLPLKGPNFDGHEYIEVALENGAAGAFCEDDEKYLSNFKNPYVTLEKIIKVKDTLETYHKLAKHHLKKVNPIVVAITGSSGKTTTKEMMHHVLAEKYKVHYTHANFNNEIGVPKTILETFYKTEVLILEMGMRGLGEISLLSEIAEPDIALITNIGTAHIELLGSKENIQKAKLEITDHLKDDGEVFIDENLFKKLKTEGYIDKRLDKTILKCKTKNHKVSYFDHTRNFEIKGLAGDAIHSDANAVAMVARKLGLREDQIQDGLNKYQPNRGRGSFHKDPEGNIFIDDSYNANPDSVKASLEAMLEQFPDRRKVIFLGHIAESDEQLINELYDHIESKKEAEEKKLILMKVSEENFSQRTKELKNLLNSGTAGSNVVLVKGSREAKVERVFEEIKVN